MNPTDAQPDPHGPPGTGPILTDARWCGDHGIGRFARELIPRLGLTHCGARGHAAGALSCLRLGAALRRRGDARGFWSPGFIPPWPAPAGTPTLVTVHDLIHLRSSRPWVRGFVQRVLRPAVRAAPAVVTVSQAVREELASWAAVDPARVAVVPNGVSTAFTPGPGRDRPLDRPYVLCVGHRRPHKNLARLAAALGVDRGPCAEVGLVLVGAPDRATSRRLAACGLLGRVRWLGPNLADAALAAAYRGAAATAVVSTEEGFGLPVIESMACGTPVVASATGALAETAGDAAELVDALDPASIRAGLDRVLADSQRRSALIARGLEHVRPMTWERSAAALARALAAAGLTP